MAPNDDSQHLGYNVKHVGTYSSIRKGAASYLSSLPSGPNPTPICIHGGWMMGQVQYPRPEDKSREKVL